MTHAGLGTDGFSAHLTQGVLNRIEAAAYKMIYDEGILPKLFTQVGKGQKGGAVIWPYFDPSTIATAASTLAEENDFVTWTQLTNASVIIVASEFGVASLLSDTVSESGTFDFEAELARQQALGVAVKLEKHCLAALSAGFTTGTITGTGTTTGFTFAKFAAAKSKLDAAALTVPGRKVAVVPTYGWYLTALGTYSATYASVMGSKGAEVQSKFYVDTLFGDIDIYTEGLAYITASTTAAGYMFSRNAVAMWKPRDYRIEPQRDASKRATEFTSTMRAGAKTLVAGYGVRLKMTASAPS
jgi:hypothetical protein